MKEQVFCSVSFFRYFDIDFDLRKDKTQSTNFLLVLAGLAVSSGYF
jgi:hypothetical protein